MRKLKWKVVALGAVVAGGAVGMSGIAGADSTAKATTYVDGFDEVTDDFNDHEREAGVLCDDCNNARNTDLVMSWQALMLADGMFEPSDGQIEDHVDGYFDTETADATARWQGGNGLDATGEVDQATWAAADDRLEVGGEYVIFRGLDDGRVTFIRDAGTGMYYLDGVARPDGDIRVNTESESRIWLFEQSISLGHLS